MRILLLGSGGREHAFAWKIAQSSQLDKLFIAPGNAGTSEIGVNVDIQVDDFEAIGNFSVENKIDFVMVGPEGPLVNGIHDYFLANEKLKNIDLSLTFLTFELKNRVHTKVQKKLCVFYSLVLFH